MSSKMGPLLDPAANPHVRVVALREDPPVPAWNDSELDPGGLPVRLRVERPPGNVPLERDTTNDPLAQPGRACDDAVGAIGADEVGGVDLRAPDDGREPAVIDDELVDPDSVAEVGARCSGLLREVEVEPAPLRHAYKRRCARTRDRTAISRTQYEAIDDVLDDRLDVAGHVPQRPSREASSAGLVAWEARLVHEEHTCAASRKVDRGGRARRARSNDKDVEPLHDPIVGRRRPRGYNCPPRRDSRVAKGGGL